VLRAHDIVRVANGRRLLDRVGVVLAEGQINLIVGPNGAGKSTLLKVLSGQVRPDAGSVTYGDVDVASMTPQRLARVRAILSQHLEIAFPLRVDEVVMMGRYPHIEARPSVEDERVCADVMRLFDVAGMAHRDFATLSGGEQQRVHFARVLAQIWLPSTASDRYLFLDEPLTFLDVFHQFEFMRTLQSLARREGLVVAGVVHDLNLAARFGEHLVLLHEGKVLAAGLRDEVLTRENIAAAFRLTPTILRSSAGHPVLLFE
jgi:iron complex transport system ATP-binding protein